MSAINSSAATVVTYTVDPDKADALRSSVEQHLIPAARGAEGYRGFLLLDQGDGKRMAMVLFDSAEHAKAAQKIIGPVAREHVYDLMATRSGGAFGTAIVADGIFA